MANNFNYDSSTNVYNDDTITYFEDLLRHSPEALNAIDINISQSQFTEFPSFSVTAEAVKEVTNSAPMLTSSVASTQSCDNTFPNLWQQGTRYNETGRQESGDDILGRLLENVVVVGNTSPPQDARQIKPLHCAIAGTTEIPHLPKDIHDVELMDTSPSEQKKTVTPVMVTQKMSSDSDTVFLEQLNAIFGDYSGNGSPEVTSTIDDPVNFGSGSEPLSTCTKTTSPVTKTTSKMKASGSLKSYKMQTDEQYRKIRDRNNTAVKKSRLKAKQRQMTAEKQVALLQEENKELKKKVESLSSELNTLKSLLTSVIAARPDVVNLIKDMDTSGKSGASDS